ncbi:MAG: hypothetical protein QW545_07075 [Thermosphaera sp.]
MGYEAHPRYSNIDTYKNTLQLLEQEPEIIDLLKRIIQWEEEMVGSPSYDIGFRSEDVFADPRKLAKLVPRGILRLSYKSSNDTRYRAYNLEELKRAVEDWERGRALAKAPEEDGLQPYDIMRPTSLPFITQFLALRRPLLSFHETRMRRRTPSDPYSLNFLILSTRFRTSSTSSSNAMGSFGTFNSLFEIQWADKIVFQFSL